MPVLSKGRVLLSIGILLVLFTQALSAEKTGIVQSDVVIVHFEEPLRKVAQEVETIYPAIIAELEMTFGWRVDFIPTVVLIKDHDTFQRNASHKLVVAYAVPQRYLIVIDHSKMRTHPFNVRVTLKHELSHLLLHHHIRGGNLPKWFDEGLSQWVSGGIAEILMAEDGATLKQASLLGNFLRMRDLTRTFPRQEKSLMLAYEETKSIVEFIDKEFGTIGIRRVLNRLRDGDTIDGALRKGLSLSLDELEQIWHASLRSRITWLTYFSNHLYTILFSFAGLVTVYGFIRLIVRRRAYKDEEEDMIDGMNGE